MPRRFFTLPAGTKPPVQQQTKLKAVKKDAAKEKEEHADESIVKDEKETSRALKPEDGEGDAVMTGIPEVEGEEVVSEKMKEEVKMPATKNDETGECRLFPCPSVLVELIYSHSFQKTRSQTTRAGGTGTRDGFRERRRRARNKTW